MTCNCPGCPARVYKLLYTSDLNSWVCEAGHAWTSQSKPGQVLSELVHHTKRPPNPTFYELAV